jgi:iron complex outermembrane receptor protein
MKIVLLLFIIIAIILPVALQAQSDTLRLEEVVVTGTRARVNRSHVPMTISVISRQEIEESHESALLSILSGRVPGLFLTERGILGFGVGNTGAGTLALRGIGDGTRLLVLIDGHPQYMGLMGHHLPDAHAAANVERVEIVRGPASLLYGSNAMGGAINIITRGATQKGWSGDGHFMAGAYNTRQYQAGASYKGERWETFFSLNHDRTDGHRADKSARFHITNGYAKAGLRLSNHFRAWGDVNLVSYETQNPGIVTNPILDNVANILRGTTSVTIENDFGKIRGALSLFYNFGDHEIDDGYYPLASSSNPKEPRNFRFRSKDHHYGIQLYQVLHPFRGTTLTAGIDFKRFGGRAWDDYNDGTTPDNVNADTSLHEIAGYIIVQQALFDKLTLTAGTRVENNEHFGTEWIPQAGVTYRPFRNGFFKASIAKGFRSPNIRDLFYKAGWAAANPDLRPETMINREVSAGQEFLDGHLSVEFTAFIATGKNMIVTETSGGVRQNKNTGAFTHRGLEFSARWEILHDLGVQANYSYLHTKKPVLYAPQQQANVTASYHPGRWHISTSYRHARDLRSTATRAETFNLWNARVAYRPLPWLGVFAKGENLGDTRYQIIDGYPMPGTTVTGGLHFHF